MLENISVLNFLIYATCFGFAVAIVYTNIQRTALSKFITYLVTKNIFSQDNAATLKSVGLGRTETAIIKSAVKNQHGLKRCIKTVKATAPVDKLEAALEGAEDDKYYLNECNTEELLKKYSFKPLATKTLLMFIAALIIVVIAVTAAVDWMIKKVALPELEEQDEHEIAEPHVPEITNPDGGSSTGSDSTDTSDNGNKDETSNETLPDSDDQQGTGPRIPILNN